MLLTAKGGPGIRNASLLSSPDAVTAMAIFTSEQEPWSTTETATEACMFINVACQDRMSSILERLLKEKIRPLFSKSRNPAVTREGRKDLHPVPLPRFDGSILDDSTRPWKNTDIYATSLLRWIVSQYTVWSGSNTPTTPLTPVLDQCKATLGDRFPPPRACYPRSHRRYQYSFQNPRL